MPDFTDLVMKIRNSGLPEQKKAEIEKRLIREGPGMDVDQAIEDARFVPTQGISIPLTPIKEKIPTRIFLSKTTILKISLWSFCILGASLLYPALTKTVDSLENNPKPSIEQPKSPVPSPKTSVPTPSPTPPKPSYQPPPKPIPTRPTPPATPPQKTIQPRPRTNKKWYVGGTLHQAYVSEWWRASESNRLATCGDFISALILERKLNIKFSDVDDLLPYAYQLMTCINATTRDFPEIQNTMVKEIAALCVVGSGWWKK